MSFRVEDKHVVPVVADLILCLGSMDQIAVLLHDSQSKVSK